ncbi:hypothetical protein BsWGS_04807 [Bradybaena similaris]
MVSACAFICLLLVLVVIVPSSFAALCRNISEEGGYQNPPDGVCRSVDIRMTMDQFRQLENCTVVEGFLHISLIERAVEEDYAKWSFPELREITGYVRLYRVYGLKTLRRLFPNLTVIGGRQLFNNYAFVAYEMPDLEELGLVSLRTIGRGGIRITKSKKLCYVDTIDWGKLGVSAGAQDFKDNKEESSCANYCPDYCPTTKVGNLEAKRCWTSQHCQLGLNCRCKRNQTCMDNGTCCHDYCMGGCVGRGPGDCYSCKGVTYQGKCQPKCPPSTFMFSERRCLTERECLALGNNTNDIGKRTKVLRGDKDEPSLCVTECPQNYTIQEEGALKNLECIRCKGFCPKICNSTEITSIEDAEKLKGCSKIIGPLDIQIMSGNVAQELTKNLGSIKEVTGYIIIKRSYALRTLFFLKSLEIFGDSPLLNGNSLILVDNTNLQELFPEEQMKKMKFKTGRVSFHGNHRLCLYKINHFLKYLNLKETPTEKDISRATNGDLISCIEQHLNLSVTDVHHDRALLNWTKDTSNTSHQLTYIINYKEIKDESDIDIYQGRDACSIDVWMTTEQPSMSDLNPYQTYALEDLKAYTTYAVYIQAYTLLTATHSAVTNVETFITSPSYPSEPLHLEVSSDDPNELIVKWKPPKLPNGIVTHYKVTYQKLKLSTKSFEQRDYCHDPNSSLKKIYMGKKEETERKHNATENCCVCPKSKQELEAEYRKQEIETYFENYLHGQAYCQRYKTASSGSNMETIQSNAISKGVIDGGSSNTLVSLPANASGEVNLSHNNTLTLKVHEVLVYNATRVVLQNLQNFQEYNIEVQACHDTDANQPGETKLCSNRALTSGRTKPSLIKDSIQESTIEVKIVVNMTSDVIISWKPPPEPNGLILRYNIFYKRANLENLVPQLTCVNSREFMRNSGVHLTGLDHGNWTFQINAVSLAGNGSLTSEKFFIVPHLPVEEETDSVIIIITAVIITVTVIIIITSILSFLRFRLHKGVLTVISPNINYVSSDQMYTIDDWEVDRDKIKLIRELGQGAFGMVYEGVAKGLGDNPDKETKVAVKTISDTASFTDRREFLKEATTMKAFDCFHVVKLLGVVSSGQPALVIMELMALGDLKNYLREHRPDEIERPGISPPSFMDILEMAGEIADGMAYLADKKFVHRDLAARNCMVAEDKTVKIGDFGMTRDIYETDYYRKGGKGMLPVRWMAPESLTDGVFTSMSDVWSYGVVLWEMVTLAAQPYQGLSNEEVVKFVSEDCTMDVPDGCPDKIAHLMRHCWTRKPKGRPTFKEIIESLLPDLNLRFKKVSYYFRDGHTSVSRDLCSTGDVCGVVGGDETNSRQNSEGAVAASLSPAKDDTFYQCHCSPSSKNGSCSLCDDDVDPDQLSFIRRDQHVDNMFRHIDNKSDPSELCMTDNSSRQSSVLDDFQSDLSLQPSPMSLALSRPLDSVLPMCLTSKLPDSALPMSPSSSGLPDSVLPMSNVVHESLLHNKDCDPPHSLTREASSGLDLSEYVGYQPLIITKEDPQDLEHNRDISLTTVDPLRTDPFNSTFFGQSADKLSTKPVLSPVVKSPRLSALGQPPRTELSSAPLYKKESKTDSSSKNCHFETNSQDNLQPVSAAVTSTTNDVLEETSSPLLPQHNSSLCIVTSASDDGQDSRVIDIHSFNHTFSNGHMPISKLRHQTAPC